MHERIGVRHGNSARSAARTVSVFFSICSSPTTPNRWSATKRSSLRDSEPQSHALVCFLSWVIIPLYLDPYNSMSSKILVVEHEPDMQQMIAVNLQQAGYRAPRAANLPAAPTPVRPARP